MTTKYCCKCGQLIRPGEDYDTCTPDCGSGAAPDVYRHKACPRPAARR